MIDTSSEMDAQPGDILERENGDRYLALPNGYLAFIGNKDSSTSGLVQRSEIPCKFLKRVLLPDYKGAGRNRSLEEDWDVLKGITHFKTPLPRGCSCSYAALEEVLHCGVHKVKAEVDDHYYDQTTIDPRLMSPLLEDMIATEDTPEVDDCPF